MRTESSGAGIRFHRSPSALWRRVGADVLVVMPADPEIRELSGGARAVWDALGEAQTPAELVDRLAASHGVEARLIASDVDACLTVLVGSGLVEPGSLG